MSLTALQQIQALDRDHRVGRSGLWDEDYLVRRGELASQAGGVRVPPPVALPVTGPKPTRSLRLEA